MLCFLKIALCYAQPAVNKDLAPPPPPRVTRNTIYGWSLMCKLFSDLKFEISVGEEKSDVISCEKWCEIVCFMHLFTGCEFGLVCEPFILIFTQTYKFVSKLITKTHHTQSKHIKTHQNTSKHIKTHQNTSKHIKTHRNISKTHQTHQNTSKHIKHIKNTSKTHQTHQNTSKHIKHIKTHQTHQNTSKHIKTHQTLKTHQNTSKQIEFRNFCV